MGQKYRSPSERSPQWDGACVEALRLPSRSHLTQAEVSLLLYTDLMAEHDHEEVCSNKAATGKQNEMVHEDVEIVWGWGFFSV